VTTVTVTQASIRRWQISSEAQALLEKFPPRPVAASWPRTRQDRAAVEDRLGQATLRVADKHTRCHRNLSLQAALVWLELYPGKTWQQRWDATGAGRDGHRDWRTGLVADLEAAGLMGHRRDYIRKVLGMGLLQLIGADYVRPSLGWLMVTSSPLRIANEMAKVRDPHGVAELRAVRMANMVGDATMLPAIERTALIMAAKGDTVRDITVGDCLELRQIGRDVFPGPTLYRAKSSVGVVTCTFVAARQAARWYWLMTPPRTRRRRMGASIAMTTPGPWSGGCCLRL
jgi:hypothetical protein